MTTINGSTTFAQAGVGLDMEGQLALLVLESEGARHEAASDDKQLARERFIAASDKGVAAMHEEADDILNGAFAQGAASLAACSIQIADVASEPESDASGKAPAEKPWGEIGAAAFNAASQPVGKVLGDAPAADDRADAKRAGTSAQQATWQLDDATDAIRSAEQRQDKTLDWLASTDANQASAETGIIAGFA